MSVIKENADLVTLIVVFTVEPDDQEAHVKYLQEVASEHSKLEGFVSCAVHRSEDGVRVAEYIQWRSRAHLEAMLATPAARAHVTNPAFTSDAHSYQVASVFEASGQP